MSATPVLAALRAPLEAGVAVRPTSRVFLQNAAVLAAGGVFVVAVVLFTPRYLQEPYLFIGIGVALVSVAVALVLPWETLPSAAATSVPLLQLLALGVKALGGLPVALLAVFPVLALARHHGRRGALAGTVGGILVAWAPMLASPVPPTPGGVPIMLLVPIVLLTVATTVAGVERSARARSRLLSQQDGHLQDLLDDLVSEREMLSRILGALPAGVLVLDQDGRVVLANSRLHQLTGGLAAAPVPPWRDQGLDLDDDECDPRVRLASVARRALAGESVAGETAWWREDRARGRGGRALRQSTVQLPRRRDERALRVVLLEDLTQEELAVEQREDFVRAVSHELRTPLTSVVGYVELARESEAISPDAADMLDVAQRNAGRVLSRVEDLLVSSSLRAGVLSMNLAPVDLRLLVAEAVAQARPAAASAGIEIENRVRGSWVVRGDADLLAKAVQAVLSNAVTYSDAPGEVVLTMEGVGEQVCLRFSDRGIGMSEEDRGRVFERFFRSPAVVSSSRHGTGLGLHMVRGIVTGHGGDVVVHSALGEGTSVEITLPVGGVPR